MKYYSETLNKLFESSEELIKEEKAYKKAQDEAQKKAAREQAAQEKAKAEFEQSKKQYAIAVEEADLRVSEAYKILEIAKDAAKELSEEYIKKLSDIIEPAKQEVKEAEMARLQAIREFNEKFGTYKVNLSGDRATAEYMRARNYLADIFNIFNKLN